MKNKIKILMAAAEITPLAKVGGLGDVIGALPKALKKSGTDIRLVLPCYGSIDRKKYRLKKIAGRNRGFWKTYLPNTKIPVYLIDHVLFQGKEIYQAALADEAADLKKFLLFSEKILELLPAVGFNPDIIHLNDWHTAAVAGLIKTRGLSIQTVYTIHNLSNQGIIKNQNRNLMAEGIKNANFITTVSPTYAQEILTSEYGAGLNQILAENKNKLRGILNGIDVDFFNPTTDQLINRIYSAKQLTDKLENKISLRQEFGWPANGNQALVGMVTRLVWQKGLELIEENLLKLNCQFVFLGTGEKKYEQKLNKLTKKYPDKFKALIKFDEVLAHKIYAASDLFLVPSKFEPCGLTQMVAMRYGSIPIVRSTGGLADTVSKTNGFIFKNFSQRELRQTLMQALNIFYHQPETWRRLQFSAMKKDFSWEKSAAEYLKLYKKLSS